MKRFHVSVAVTDLERSTRFYSTLFGTEPAVRKDDYAKWMLEDPRLNFSITTNGSNKGVSHVGLQADTMAELGEIQARLRNAELKTADQDRAKCCYATSSKTWVRDPDDVSWETFVTHGDVTTCGDDAIEDEIDPGQAVHDGCRNESAPRCCT